MALAIRAGADPDQTFEVISNSAGNSWMFSNRVPHILAGDYTPLSAVDIFVKDLGIVLDYAKKSVFPLPLSATAHQMYMQASAAGHGREDDSAVIKIFPGIALPQAAQGLSARAAARGQPCPPRCATAGSTPCGSRASRWATASPARWPAGRSTASWWPSWACR